MHYVYTIVNTKNGKLYIGYTANLRDRHRGHQQGSTKSTAHGIWKLAYYEAFLSKKDATQREWDLKHQGRQRDFVKKNIQESYNTALSSNG